MIVMPVRCRKPHSASERPIAGLPSGTGIHSIVSSPERHLELLDDLRALVRAAQDGAELARLIVVESDHGTRLLVARVPEEVDLADPVGVQDDRDACALAGLEGVLDADSRQACLP